MRAFRRKDIDKFNRLIKLIDTEQRPICFSNESIKIRNKSLIKLAFLIRLFVPIAIPRTVLRLYRKFQTTPYRPLPGSLSEKDHRGF